jgi:hypothetical protein
VRPRRILALLAAALLSALTLQGAVATGGATARVATLPRLPTPAPLNYGPDPTRSLSPVRREFIRERIGAAQLAPLPASAPRTAASAAPAAAVVKQYRCVNGHQTDDPLSPPCNTNDPGPNGGATYQGVTSDEIKVVAFMVGNYTLPCSNSPDDTCPPEYPNGIPVPKDGTYDLDQPVPSTSPLSPWVRGLHGFEHYFNQRFQTYGRRVHLYLFVANSSNYYPADSEKGWAKTVIDALHPFAVVVIGPDFSNHFSAEVARRGVATFTDLNRAPELTAFYAKHPNLLWGYWPSIEQQATTYASYVCEKVIPHAVSMSGNLGANGTPRKIGLLNPYGYDTLAYAQLADDVARRVEACGGRIADRGEFPVINGCGAQVDLARTPTSAAAVLARFKLEGITTVLWTGCYSSSVAVSSVALQYLPEWIVMGEPNLETNAGITLSGLTVPFAGHAVLVTPNTATPPLPQRRCYEALRSVDPTITSFEVSILCREYGEFRQLFSSIQLAGPRLGPASLGAGTRRLPRVDSTDPLTPTCFYATDTDTTCVKDATAMYWDATASTTYNPYYRGCWKPLEDGRRYLPGRWPSGNIDAQRTGAEPCNSLAGDAGVISTPNRDYTNVGGLLLGGSR